MNFLLDTNFLVYCAKQRIDLLAELSEFGKPELFVLSAVIEELGKLALGKSISSMAARLALGFAEKNAKQLASKGKADETLLRKSRDFIICTNDRELITKIRRRKGKSVSIRNRKLLMMS